ncbi:MAG: helix-hairpin-helix domain-containing protein [Gammaproteobacteria bacterium]|nr:helix-hairpin-helix domain-containing protein [Gammaproteobacteria bacterium]
MKSILIQLVLLSLLSVAGTNIVHAAKPEKSSQKPVTADVKVAMININEATAAEMAEQLKGVGLKRAEAIVSLRKQLGGFKKVEQLLDVKGIGEATLNKNKAIIRL